jgi:uncharacterized OB-fold protein
MSMSPTANVPPAPAPQPIKPAISDTNKPFWDGCRAHKLMAQQCTHCQELRYPVAAVCPNCLSTGCEWRELSGRGELFSYIIIHRGYHPYWAQRVPYNVAFIELEEGLRMFSNIVGTPNDALKVGQKVKVAFEERGEDLVVPVFEVVGGS